MKKTKFSIPIILFLSVALFTALFPFPIFSHYTNLNNSQMFQVNNYYETELKNNYTNKNRLLDISWSEGIDTLFDTHNIFEAINLLDGNSLYVKRIGGKNHADIIFTSQNDFQYIQELSNNDAYIPILLKINENTFVPASFSHFPHGYQSHYCVHFKGTKTDGTQKYDSTIQNSVRKAKRLSQKYLTNI